MAGCLVRDLVLVFIFSSCLYGEVSGQTQTNATAEILQFDQTSDPGTSVNFTCQLSTGTELLLTHTYSWVYVSRVPGQTEEKVLIDQQRVFYPDQYDQTLGKQQSADDPLSFTLIIKQVSGSDDGRYICRVRRIAGGTTYLEAEGSLTVPNPVERVAIQIDGMTPITGDRKDKLTIRPGLHGVVCGAFGFNPQTIHDLHLHIDNEEQQGAQITGPVLLEEESTRAKAPRYSVEKRWTLDLHQTSGDRLIRCSDGSSPELSASTIINGGTDHTDQDDNAGGSPENLATTDHSVILSVMATLLLLIHAVL